MSPVPGPPAHPQAGLEPGGFLVLAERSPVSDPCSGRLQSTIRRCGEPAVAGESRVRSARARAPAPVECGGIRRPGKGRADKLTPLFLSYIGRGIPKDFTGPNRAAGLSFRSRTRPPAAQGIADPSGRRFRPDRKESLFPQSQPSSSLQNLVAQPFVAVRFSHSLPRRSAPPSSFRQATALVFPVTV